MKKVFYLLVSISLIIFINSCTEKKTEVKMNKDNSEIEKKIAAFAPTEMKADLSGLTENQQKVIQNLIEAGKLADEVFWRQTSSDAIFIRDSLAGLSDERSKLMSEYVRINYGPYDMIHEKARFVGTGPMIKPKGATYYPDGMKKEDFEKFIAENPDKKDKLESQYTVVLKQGDGFKAIPFHASYPEVPRIAEKLLEAAKYADDPTLKNYLELRAKALLTDEYYESDLAWMDVTGDIDIVIGPIENYLDDLFNYKTAFECGVFVKDAAGTNELEMFNSHIPDFEKNLPVEPKYIPKVTGKGKDLKIVNVVYFAGDFQEAVKTIATSLPNDPKVHEARGVKNLMFKNMIEAKFDKIVVPIAQKLLDESLHKYVDKKSFMSFVTLHEVSHTLGLSYVLGNKQMTVRKALKERYSAIEETKADIMSMFNHKTLFGLGKLSAEDLKRSTATYLAGLYRSVRFGAEEAHGKANLIQLNFLKEKGAFVKQPNGKYIIDDTKFFAAVRELANLVLMIEAGGNYEQAGKILEKYAVASAELKAEIDMLQDVPRDLDTKYSYKIKKGDVSDNSEEGLEDAFILINR